MDHILDNGDRDLDDDDRDRLHDMFGRIIIPAQLVQDSDPRLTIEKCWIKLVGMLKTGEDTIRFENREAIAEALGYKNPISIYKVLRKLEKFGWIVWDKGRNHYYRDIYIKVLSDPRPLSETEAETYVRDVLEIRPEKGD